MKVLVISANKENNLGDVLIYESLKEYCEAKNVRVSSVNFRLQYYDQTDAKIDDSNKSTTPDLKEYLKKNKYLYILSQVIYFIIKLPKYYKNFKPFYKESDRIIIGGGQLLMDTPKNILFHFNFLFHILMAKKYKKELYFVGIGIAEKFNFKFSEKIITYAFSYAEKIICRDIYSFEKALLYCTNSKKISHSSDLAILYNYQNKCNKSYDKNDKKSIGISTLAYYDKRYFPVYESKRFNEYKMYLSNLNKYLDKSFKVSFIPTTKIDTVVANEINSAITIPSANHIELIININNQDLFIATRMHSFIISLMLNKPSLCFLWDHKIKGFIFSLYGFKSECFLFDFNDLSNPELMLNKLDYISTIDLQDNIQQLKQNLTEVLDEIIDNN